MMMRDEIRQFSEISAATVIELITATERGRVAWQASYWFAEFYQLDGVAAAFPRQQVKVIGRRNITLLVVPV